MAVSPDTNSWFSSDPAPGRRRPTIVDADVVRPASMEIVQFAADRSHATIAAYSEATAREPDRTQEAVDEPLPRSKHDSGARLDQARGVGNSFVAERVVFGNDDERRRQPAKVGFTHRDGQGIVPIGPRGTILMPEPDHLLGRPKSASAHG